MSCSKCMTEILPGDGINCTVCKCDYHYGCQSMLEVNFRKMGKKVETWKCSDCKLKPKHITEVVDAGTEANTAHMRKLFEEFTGKVGKKIDNVLDLCKEMKEKIIILEDKQNELEKENETLKKNIEEMKTQYEDRFDHLENRSRICNLEIRNFPEKKDEDVVKIVCEIGKAIGIQNFTEGDVQVAHRVDLRSKERGNRPIIAHMASRFLRNKWLNHYRNFVKSRNTGQRTQLTAKAINKNLTEIPIYINEHITVQKKILLNKCKETAKKHNVKHVWVKDAFIMMRKNDNGPVQKINNMKELEEYTRKIGSSGENFSRY